MSNEVICEAIETEKKLKFNYKGRPRRVQPYIHGWTADGDEMFKAYQTAGGSESFSNPHWRNFKPKNISELQLTDEDFTRVREDYDIDQDNNDYDEIHCKADR